MELPSFDTYCDNTTAANAQVFDIGYLRVWYSYKTPVAFMVLGQPKVVRENDWGPTTGKHLNAIDGGDKRSRVPSADFELLLAEALQDKVEV